MQAVRSNDKALTMGRRSYRGGELLIKMMMRCDRMVTRYLEIQKIVDC